MADNKYGRIFTQGDVEKILEWVEENTNSASAIEVSDIVPMMEEEGARFKFEPDEPVFVLRGRDRRAFGALRFYQDHQARSAPPNHLDSIEKAIRAFSAFRENNGNLMREPD